MIKGVFIINSNGKARLVKLYEPIPDDQQQAVVREVHSLISKRPPGACNFVEGSSLSHFGRDTKLVYREYSSLFFVFAVDGSESELGILDLCHVLVEVLDKCFKNVCELDLIMNPEKLHYVLDEMITGGLVLETSAAEVFEAVSEQAAMAAGK